MVKGKLCWRMETSTVCLVVWVGYNVMQPLKSGGERTELFLTHTGVRAHDSSMGQDSGVGACNAFTDGDGVSKGCWATEQRRFQSWKAYPIGRRILKEKPHYAALLFTSLS